MKMNCKRCGNNSVKNGLIKSTGKQRYYCKTCNVSFVLEYTRKAFEFGVDEWIIRLLKEGCGTRSIARILKISPKTVTIRLIKISESIKKPSVFTGRKYEMDEMITFIGNKEQRICIAYAIDRKTRDVVSFSVGRRNKTTLRMVVNTLLLSGANEIRTDKFSLYPALIPEEIQYVKRRGTNYIERNNLTIRTHIKRLNRRTIAYSKSLLVLSAVLKIYFWG